MEQVGDTGWERALEAFDSLGRLVEDQEYRGCTFINVAVEMTDQEHNFAVIAVAHKNFVRETFARYLTGAGIEQTEPLATQLLILMNGLFVSTQVHSNFREAASQARLAAEVLLDVALAADLRSVFVR